MKARVPDRDPLSETHCFSFEVAFTLIELLVVIAIIAILAASRPPR